MSDDTQLAICVSRSILPDGRYSHARFFDELAGWSYFRIGAGRACSLAAVRARRSRLRRGEKSEGNGVAIRVAPFAIVNAAGTDRELIALVEENGRATHDSDAAIRAGAFVAVLVKLALVRPPGSLDDPGELRSAVQSASNASGFDIRLPSAFDAVATDAGLLAALRQVGTSGHVQQCAPAAALVLLHHRLDFRAAMRSIFCAGGDTDSIGAIVGAVIGAQLGVRGLPSEWDRVQHRDYLCWLADRLATPTAATEATGHVACVVGDVSSRPVDVVVNAWNRNAIPPWLLLPQGVSKAIRRAGGSDTIRAVGRRAPLPLGTATETAAAHLRSRWVVHVAGIDLLWRASESSVRDATRSALLLARWLGARSVALPLIGTGSGGLNEQVVEETMRAELHAQRAHFDLLELVRLARPC